jgi:hypothetical protein
MEFGLMAWFSRGGRIRTDEQAQAAAEHEARLYCRRHPGILIWVAPWPNLQAARYPRAPWTEMPQEV